MKLEKSAHSLPAIAALAAMCPCLAYAAQPDNGAPASQSALQEVVVTATKQGSANIQNVPMSISVVNTADLDRKGMSSLGGFVNSLPSISMQQYGPGQNKFAIRGISDPGNIDPTNVVDQSLVSVYLDDTPISLQGATPDLKVFDLERVEVIRGPQGTLYGAGAMAGTLRLITQKPDAKEVYGYAEGDGSYTDGGGANWSARAMTNIPVIQDRLGLRLSGYGARESGWIDNIGTHQRDANSVVTVQFRAAARFKISDRLTIDTSITHARTETEGNNDAYANLGPSTFTSFTPEYYHDRLMIANVTAHYATRFADLVSSGSYTDRSLLNRTDASFFDSNIILGGAEVLPSWQRIDNHISDFVQEVRLSRTRQSYNWIVGVYYDHSHRRYFQNNPWPGLDTLLGISSVAFGAPAADDLFYSDQTLAQREIAGFGQLTYTVFRRLDLTAGARYFNYRQTYDLYFAGLAGSLAPGEPLVQTGRTPESGVNPRFAASYHLTSRSMIFAEAAKGYRYGGVNQPVPLSFCASALAAQGLGSAPLAFGPDQLWSYSLGEKSTVAGGRATLDATAFYIDWRGMQTNDTLNCGYYFTQNAGHVTSKGAEFGAQARLSTGFSISLNGSYTDAKAAAPIANLSAPEGAPVPYFPKYILNGSAQYEWPLAGDRTLVMEADDQYRSATYNDFDPAIRRQVPASNVIDSALTLMAGRWEIGVYCRNLTDHHVVTSIATNTNGPMQPGDAYYYAPPRIVGLRARVNF